MTALMSSLALASEAPVRETPVAEPPVAVVTASVGAVPSSGLDTPFEPSLLGGGAAPHRGLRTASLVFHALSVGTTVAAVGISQFGRTDFDGVSALFALGLVSMPLSAVGAGLFLVPSLSLRGDSALLPVLGVSSAAIAAVGLAGLGIVGLYGAGSLSQSTRTDWTVAIAAGAAVLAPLFAAPLGLMGLGLERRMRSGPLRPQLSVLPQRGGAQVAMQLSF